jgi:tRNA A37 threonylcarbamoyladenosine synthetase subunit TsaC/SUA5/YrdC
MRSRSASSPRPTWLDGGETEHKMASTVVDCTGAEPRIIREGAIPADQIMAAAHGGA